MSYSTTATSKFLLEKYSRAYPKSTKSQSQGPDWQHFSNPTLYVVLDKTKSHKGDLESLRMRVLWYINGEGGEENPSAASQPPEDLDLFSFSAIQKNMPKKKNGEGLPIKAICRDTLVGIRYLCSKDDAPQPVYNRIQINFLSTKDASEFIHAIRTVCPCKAATPGQGTVLNSAATNADFTLPLAPAMTSRTASTAQHKVVVAPTSSIASFQTNSAERSSHPRNQDFFRPTVSSNPASAFDANSDISRHLLSSDAAPFTMAVGDKLSNEIPASVTKSAVATSQLMGPPAFIPGNRLPRPTNDMQERPVHLHLHQPTQQYSSSQLPPSSPLPPSDHASSDPLNIAPSSSSSQPTSQADAASAVLTSLREATGLYDLSNEALERVVAEVIREEGFQQLVSESLQRSSRCTLTKTITDTAIVTMFNAIDGTVVFNVEDS